MTEQRRPKKDETKIDMNKPLTEVESKQFFGVDSYWLGKLSDYGYINKNSFGEVTGNEISRAIAALQNDFGIKSAWKKPEGEYGIRIDPGMPHMTQQAAMDKGQQGQTNSYHAINNLDKIEALYVAYKNADKDSKWKPEGELADQVKAVLQAFPYRKARGDVPAHGITLDIIAECMKNAGYPEFGKDIQALKEKDPNWVSENLFLPASPDNGVTVATNDGPLPTPGQAAASTIRKA